MQQELTPENKERLGKFMDGFLNGTIIDPERDEQKAKEWLKAKYPGLFPVFKH